MPSIKNRGVKSRPDKDVTPFTGPPVFDVERIPPPDSPINRYETGDISDEIRAWIAKETARRGKRPSNREIEKFRSRYGDVPEVKRTPEVHDAIEPETRIRGT